MPNLDTAKAGIKGRFFQAIDELIARKALRGFRTLPRLYGENYGNFYQMKQGKLSLDIGYLNFLVVDFGISARWLLTGEGEMFAKKSPNTPSPEKQATIA